MEGNHTEELKIELIDQENKLLIKESVWFCGENFGVSDLFC